MAGLAKSESFQFSVADLLVGPQSDQLSLNTAAHGLGLVKNVTVTSTPTIVSLTQGLTNDEVYSVVNDMKLAGSAEVYEYSAKNLAYALSLDGTTGYTPSPAAIALEAAVVAAATTFLMVGDQTTTFTAGAWGFLQEGTDTAVHGFKITSSAYSAPNTTVTITGYPVPDGMSFSTAAGRAGVLNKLDTNPNAVDSPLACRVIGTMVADKRPLMLHFPKIKILKGFSVKFDNSSFGNMPFEFTPYTPLTTDPGYSTDFMQRMSVLVP